MYQYLLISYFHILKKIYFGMFLTLTPFFLFSVWKALRSLILIIMISESKPVCFSKSQSSHLHAFEHFPIDLSVTREEFLFF